ncbi:hypothetical protein V2J09_009282 [Rumex salicifolius]
MHLHFCKFSMDSQAAGRVPCYSDGGHPGAWRTYKLLSANVHWHGMFRAVQEFVAKCLVCQQMKYDTLAPAGLLQPLPERVWEHISMDFIGVLPNGFDCILVVVDHLTKYAHFLLLKHPFTAQVVADVFIGVLSNSMGSLSQFFWKELFAKQGTKLRMSSTYHPETDGQTAVLNQCLETYLRCFSTEQPKQWASWIHWAEYWYNINYQGAAGIIPFKGVMVGSHRESSNT